MDKRMNDDFFIDKLTNSEFAEQVSELFSEKWLVGYKYDKDSIQEYVGKELDIDLKNNPLLYQAIVYVTRLVHCTLLEDYSFFEDICSESDMAIEEISNWNKNGGLCIYSSAVCYGLLSYTKVADHSKMKLHQGFYDYKFKDGSLPAMLYPYAKGLHAWLTINDSIIDTSIMQLREHYLDDSEIYVIDKPFEGLRYFGYEEKERTPFNYLEKISFNSPYADIDKWIHHHYELSRKVVNKIISLRK